MNKGAGVSDVDHFYQYVMEMRDRIEAMQTNSSKLDMQTLKLGEEYGEFLTEWLIVTNRNIRKAPEESNLDKVRKELCDVVITSSILLAMLVNDWPAYLNARMVNAKARSYRFEADDNG